MNDRTVPLFLATSGTPPFTVKRSGLSFEGGNVVASDAFVFTGYATMIDSGISSREEAAALLCAEFGKSPVILGSAEIPEPLEHIDMYLTPIDDTTVLLGEPVLTASFETRPAEECEPEESSDSFRYEPDGSFERIMTAHMRAFLNVVKRQLEAWDFTVERIPLALDQDGNLITYNNVLMEVQQHKRVVYMPAYGRPKLDVAAMRKYRSLGFQVRAVDVSEIYVHGGSLRCVTNILARRPSRSALLRVEL